MTGAPATLARALRTHWPEYLCEASALGIFMLSACTFAVLLIHPDFGASTLIPSVPMRRALMGAAMGLTAIAIIYSPVGQRSGAHMNPAITLTFWRLGRVAGTDAVLYVAAQLAGGVLGVLAAKLVLGSAVAHESIRHVATLPGGLGKLLAWGAEFTIACILMLVVLTLSNSRSFHRFTGLAAGALVFLFITFEEPLSGMSMNPARTLGSAFWAQVWTGLWIYFTAPPIAMLAGAALYTKIAGTHRVYCAKLHHHNRQRCIFRCRFHQLADDPAPHPAAGVKPSPPEVNPITGADEFMRPAPAEVLYFG